MQNNNSEATEIQGNTRALLSDKEIEKKKLNLLPALGELPKVYDESFYERCKMISLKRRTR